MFFDGRSYGVIIARTASFHSPESSGRERAVETALAHYPRWESVATEQSIDNIKLQTIMYALLFVKKSAQIFSTYYQL
jgi:hypothetical protein